MSESRPTGLFRRKRFVGAHRRRRLLRRLLQPFLGALAVVGVPALAVAWMATSANFSVGEIVVSSSGRVPAAWARERLAPLEGRHLLSLDASAVGELLAGHPWYLGLEVRKEIPGRLRVSVEERRPAALWNRGGELVFVDSTGAAIAPLSPAYGGVDFVVIQTAAGTDGEVSRAIELSRQWDRLRPGERLSEIVVSSPGSFRLYADSFPFALDVRPETWVRQLTALERARPLLARRYPAVEVIDLRFRHQIVFQPAASPPSKKG